ncbi:LuxR C-terminal-related transcriptional regulator [Salinimicrobium soli]|uniref:LuxR C-terminal-related transcriptional regulator n=1 Tax=Salinimicrobium soli TaxID=1254399 RepID=UPI003AB0E84B
MDYSVEEKIEKISESAEMMPGVVIIHDISKGLQELKTVYMSSRGLTALGMSLQELTELGIQYHHKFFNNDDMEGFLVKLEKLFSSKDPNETFTFFQQVRIKDRDEWVWHTSSIKIFHQDSDGNPTHLITIAIPVDKMKHIPNKAERMLAENTFYHRNYDKFNSLGKRAKEVLALVASGKSSQEIAEELNITVDTVNTHRKIIKKKLGISSSYEFTEYAHAYDLI